jgi:hypothetical protein
MIGQPLNTVMRMRDLMNLVESTMQSTPSWTILKSDGRYALARAENVSRNGKPSPYYVVFSKDHKGNWAYQPISRRESLATAERLYTKMGGKEAAIR